MKLLIGTGNAGKIREISSFLKGLPVEIVSLKDFKNITPAREVGKSFLANARLKARAYHGQTGLLTLSEDSGLQVDYLNGLPGPLSARFAGDAATDRDNVAKLLHMLRGVKSEHRRARFVCVAALADGRNMWIATGKCEGKIAARPMGTSGFGYDPIFIPEGRRTTFARLGEDVKNQMSHRAQAFAKMRRIIEKFLEQANPR